MGECAWGAVVGCDCRSRGGFDTAVRFAHALAQPASMRGGFDSGCSFVAVRLLPATPVTHQVAERDDGSGPGEAQLGQPVVVEQASHDHSR